MYFSHGMELAKIMAMEDAKTTCKTFGWFYYKRGKMFRCYKKPLPSAWKMADVMRQSRGGTVRYLACLFY